MNRFLTHFAGIRNDPKDDMKIKKGEIVELQIEKYAFEGKGIAKVSKSKLLGLPETDEDENYVVFVKGAYPGETVRAELRKIKNSYAEADVKEILTPSPERAVAECSYFGVCGGCKQQDMNYDSQIKYKQQQVEEIFTKLGGFTELVIENIIPSEKVFRYRNKMEFSFTEKRWLTSEEISSSEELDNHFALGLHVPKVYDKVVNLEHCFLQPKINDKILNLTREFFKQKNIPIYSTKTHTGYLRHLVIKNASHTDDLMVNLVTAYVDEKLMSEYKNELLNEVPQITTIINNINTKKAAIALGEYENVIYGEGQIYDLIGKWKFRISANSFFQTNTLQAENLYQTALDFADLKGDEIVYDLYSGAGTIAIFVSDHCKEVYGFESAQAAVEDCKVNIKLNNVSNLTPYLTDLYDSFLPIIEANKIPKPDVMIIDPPRSGMHKNTVDDVLKLSPQKIVYVSCNPTTQARDVKLMCEAGYKLIKMRPVDMFPHTYHIENVALLVKNS